MPSVSANRVKSRMCHECVISFSLKRESPVEEFIQEMMDVDKGHMVNTNMCSDNVLPQYGKFVKQEKRSS